MRIMLVSDSYPPLIGGATRFTQQLAHQLLHRGHKLAVVTAWQRGQPSEEDDGGVRVFRLRDLTSRVPAVSSDDSRNTPPPWPDPEAVLKIRHVMRETRPDVVHAYGWLSYSCAFALVGFDTPLVLSAQDYSFVCPKRTLVFEDGSVCSGPGLRKCLGCAGQFYGVAKGTAATVGVLGGRRLLAQRARGITHNSNYMRQRMHQGMSALMSRPGLVEDVIAAFAEPVAGEAGPDREVLDALPEQPYILFVGALRLIKGVEVLLDAYRCLRDAPPLVLMGTRAPDTPPLDAPGIHVVLDVGNATVMAAWDRALFGVAPSLLAEPLGIVVHEAMSRGRPVIGTTPGGHADMIIPGQTGVLTPRGDHQALATAMQQLLDDPELRARMGAAAQQQSRHFQADILVPRFEEVYRRVIATEK